MNSDKAFLEALHPEIPLHHQVYLQIKAQIEDGLWVGRTDFPGEEELAKQYGVSVITTRKALERLTSDGLINRGRGRRTQAIHKPLCDIPDLNSKVYLVGKPRKCQYKIVSAGVEVAPAEACAVFGMPAGEKLWICQRVRMSDGRAHSLSMHAQPAEIGLRHDMKKLERMPMWQALSAAGCKLAGLNRKIEARFVPLSVAYHFGITTHEPVLAYTYVYLGSDGGQVGWARIFLNPNEPHPREYINYEAGEWSSEAFTGISEL